MNHFTIGRVLDRPLKVCCIVRDTPSRKKQKETKSETRIKRTRWVKSEELKRNKMNRKENMTGKETERKKKKI
jgi:hypothetical protein